MNNQPSNSQRPGNSNFARNFDAWAADGRDWRKEMYFNMMIGAVGSIGAILLFKWIL